jgi:hypothetical protein
MVTARQVDRAAAFVLSAALAAMIVCFLGSLL